MPVENLNSIHVGRRPLLNWQDQVYPFMHLAMRLGVAPQPVTGNVLVNDSDVDAGSVLSVANAGTYVGTYGTLTLGANGAYTYTVNEADSAVQALKVGESVTDTFNYTVSDGVGEEIATFAA